MASITLRSSKTTPLTSAELDANFFNINQELGGKVAASSYTAADVLTKLLTVDVDASGLNASTLRGLLPATTDTISSIVQRDASGNFAANTITAVSFSGTHSGTSTGIASFTSGTLSGITSFASNGVNITGGTITGITSLASSSATITGGSITGLSSGIPVASGGTGAQTASAARTNLGLAIGTDIPSTSGTGASGTWGIGISGLAASATNAVNATKIVNSGGWNITPSGTKLYFNYNGTNVGSLDSSGNFIVIGDITAKGTVV